MRLVIVAILSAFLAAEDDEASKTRAARALDPLKSELQSELKSGMARGAVAAIEVCRTRAPEIAAKLQNETVQLGRTSHRLRNPANAPRPWVTPILEQYRADPSNAAPALVHLERGRIGYVEPIRMQPLCTVCHGKSVAQPVRDALAKLYPDDAATGFDTGDLRGAFWVEMDDPGAQRDVP